MGFGLVLKWIFLMSAISQSQEYIDGKVTLKLYKGNAYPVARESSSSLYDPDIVSMDIEGGYDQTDSEGFIKVNALRLMAHRRIIRQKSEENSNE